MSLTNKRILLGITGGIAAYKAPDLVRKLRQHGADVRVVMTKSAKEFITPLTLQAVSGNPVHDELFDLEAEAAMGHIELAKWADLTLIAPATANFIAKLAQGVSDDLLSTLCLASPSLLAIAPAMNQAMWHDPANLANIEILEKRDTRILGPGEGSQACGDIGLGRMLEPDEIAEKVQSLFETGEMAGLKVVITAGPTQEAIDPVRYLTNHSSGKMGYAVAQAAIEAGAEVTLISGPVNLAPVSRAKMIQVITCEQMLETAIENLPSTDIFIGVAAVCDYRVKQISQKKIKKSKENMMLELEKNPDIVKNVSNSKQRPKIVVGFAAETENLMNNSKEKLTRKNLDMVIANQVSSPHGSDGNLGFGQDDHQVIILTKEKEITLPTMSKTLLAKKLITEIASHYDGPNKNTN